MVKVYKRKEVKNLAKTVAYGPGLSVGKRVSPRKALRKIKAR